MSIFATILSKIFPPSHPALVTPAPVQTAATSSTPLTPASAPVLTAASPPVAAMPEVDVEQVLNALAQKNGQGLNWRTSIVDLLKLLDLDSSYASRKALATELHYSGDTNDSAKMNVWLHQAVMSQLAANGGKVPADLKA